MFNNHCNCFDRFMFELKILHLKKKLKLREGKSIAWKILQLSSRKICQLSEKVTHTYK